MGVDGDGVPGSLIYTNPALGARLHNRLKQKLQLGGEQTCPDYNRCAGGFSPFLNNAFVQPMLKKVEEVTAEEYIPFTVQLLKYSKSQRRGDHRDPDDYDVIVGLTLQGSCEIWLTEKPGAKPLFRSKYKQGEFYIMHGKQVSELFHGVGKPPAGGRVCLVLRLIKKAKVDPIIHEVTKEDIERCGQLLAAAAEKNKVWTRSASSRKSASS